MSFILNALKRSDELRDREKKSDNGKLIIDLHKSHWQRRSFWPLLFLALLILMTIGGVGGTLLSNNDLDEATALNHHESAPVPVEQAAPAHEAEMRTAFSAANLLTDQKHSRPEPTITVEAAPVPIRHDPAPQTQVSEENLSSPVLETVEASLPSPSAYEDLPWEIRQQLPHLDISLHFFSDNAQRRMVRINGRLFCEGEAVESGLFIHRITPSATIFTYQGLLFEIDKPGG